MTPGPSLPQELEKLQAHLELLKQEFGAEEQLALEQQVRQPKPPAVSDSDPKRSGLNCERWGEGGFKKRSPSGGTRLWLLVQCPRAMKSPERSRASQAPATNE